MEISVISIFPTLFNTLGFGITGRAIERQLLQLNCLDLRLFADNAHGHVDDRPYGGGPGMVLRPEPLARAIEQAKTLNPAPPIILYPSPHGAQLTQARVQALSQAPHLVLLSGRYEGIDERIVEAYVDESYSIGDYVLSGGELPILVLIDALVRLLPGAVGDSESVIQESFNQGLLDHPHYTRPEHFSGFSVPKMLLSGNHEAVARWRLQQALGRTWLYRPDLLAKKNLNATEQQLLTEFIENENVNKRSEP